MMIDPTARCPQWLIDYMMARGGSISFYEWLEKDSSSSIKAIGTTRIQHAESLEFLLNTCLDSSLLFRLES